MITINGLLVKSVRWSAQWTGVWTADVDYDAGELPIPLSGRVAVVGTTEGSPLLLAGTVDPERTGVFGEKAFAHVIGGAGWGKPVRAQHYHSDIGLPLAVVVTTTAAEAGEVALVVAPSVLGTDFVRRAAAASQVFVDAGVDWWVGMDGVTRVGARIPLPAPLSLSVLDWDPAAGTVSFTCDELPEPGAIIVDLRFGTRIVRAVEALIAGGSVTGTLWLAETKPELGTLGELAGELAAIARGATRAALGRFYEYRVIAMAGDRVELHAEKAEDGVPDVLPASIWAGVSGYKAVLRPASRVLVGFIAADPKRPYVAAYEPPEDDGWRPVQLELDAVTLLTLGALATAVVIGDVTTAKPVVRLTETFTTWVAGVTSAINGLVGPGTVIAPTDLASTKVVSS